MTFKHLYNVLVLHKMYGSLTQILSAENIPPVQLLSTPRNIDRVPTTASSFIMMPRSVVVTNTEETALIILLNNDKEVFNFILKHVRKPSDTAIPKTADDVGYSRRETLGYQVAVVYYSELRLEFPFNVLLPPPSP